MDDRITAANLKLKLDGFKVSITQRGKGKFLYLVATLPPKPDSFRQRAYQQRISLGYAASVTGLRHAETQARLLGTQLITRSFDWNDWLNTPAPMTDERTGVDWVAAYKEWVLKNKLQKYDDASKNRLWRDRYWNVGISNFNIDRRLKLTHFQAVAKQQKPNSAQAKYVYREIKKFGQFCEIEGINEAMAEFKSTYNQSHTKEKIIPPDTEVEQLIPKILNTQWRYVFGMMATYGLRDHEVWQSHLEKRSGITACIVRGGKTGPRVAYPVPEQWVEKFELETVNVLPNVGHDLGKYTSRAWRRQCKRINESPKWTLYSLRHAYAIRCLMKQIPDAISSKWLGHSVDTFQKIYNKWINQAMSEEVWLDKIRE